MAHDHMQWKAHVPIQYSVDGGLVEREEVYLHALGIINAARQIIPAAPAHVHDAVKMTSGIRLTMMHHTHSFA